MESPDSNERASTPPMGNSINLRRSLGLVTSPHGPRRPQSVKSNESFSSGSSSFSPNRSSLLRCFSRSSSGSTGSPNSYSTLFANPFGDHFAELNESTGSSFRQTQFVEINVSRYRQEFSELSVIGSGEYGCVFKCYCRINGVIYAIKRTLRPWSKPRTAHNEVFAHGVLEHPNIVRQYSSWYESGYIYMQTEYCNKGSLDVLAASGPVDEETLWKVLEHIALALKYIHSLNMAHMDIKPSNIFVHQGKKVALRATDVEQENPHEELVFKLGDLGHVKKSGEWAPDIDEGDVHYMAKEVLQEDRTDLIKADIFSLGITLYEVAGGGPLPKNGSKWHYIRSGAIKDLFNISPTFNNVISSMMNPQPENRPTAKDLILTCLNYQKSMQETPKKTRKSKKQLTLRRFFI